MRFLEYKFGPNMVVLAIEHSDRGYVVTHDASRRVVRVAPHEITNVGLHDERRVLRRVAELAAKKLNLIP